MLKWGVTAAYCFARLLNRSGFGFVTVFECFSFVCIVPFVPTVTKHIQIPLRYKFTVVKRIHSLHSIPPFQSFHTLEKSSVFEKSKTPPNPRAFSRGRRLSNPCPFPAFPLAQLAVGSRRFIQPVSIAFRLAFIPLASRTQRSR